MRRNSIIPCLLVLEKNCKYKNSKVLKRNDKVRSIWSYFYLLEMQTKN